MPKKLAFMTIGILHEPFGHPRSQGFVERIPGVFAAADASDGFVARSQRDMDNYERSWGELQTPACYTHIEDVLRLPSTLSLWDDPESVLAFAYHGLHGEAMKLRRDWFVPKELPEHAAWWLDDPDRIDPADAKARLEHLHRHGPTPHAFTLQRAFDADGEPYPLDAAKVKAKAALNDGP